jgi:hypothetical protein
MKLQHSAAAEYSALPASRIMAAMVCLFWAGMILGVSFLATGVKFTAPSLSLSVALDVGRHTFAVFNKVEWFWAVALAGFLSFLRPGLWIRLGAGLVIALLAWQTFWLLPILDARVGEILAGGVPVPSALHIFYAIADMIKLIALIAAGALLLRGR